MAMLVMPTIDLCLKSFALFEEFAIDRCEPIDYCGERGPELIWLYTGSRADLVVDQLIDRFCNLQTRMLDTFDHFLSFKPTSFYRVYAHLYNKPNLWLQSLLFSKVI